MWAREASTPRDNQCVFRGTRPREYCSNPIAAARLKWDVEPKNGKDVFFSRETYDKYTLSPNLVELWRLANRPPEDTGKATGKEVAGKASGKEVTEKASGKEVTEKASGKEVTEKASGKEVTEKASGKEVTEKVSGKEVTEKVSGKEVTEKASGKEVTQKASGKEVTEKAPGKEVTEKAPGKEVTEQTSGKKVTEKASGKEVTEKASGKDSLVSSQSSAAEGDDDEQKPLLAKSTIMPLPQPPLPYPFFSSLSSADQKTYVHLMATYSSRNGKYEYNKGGQRQAYTQYMELKSFLQNEIADYLKFMHNVAKKCAEDYDHITKDALRYTEELLNASLAQVRKYPEFYSLCEITSLMGGKVCTDLTFKMEKQVLVLGKAPFFKPCFPVIPATLPLPVDYETISKSLPAERRAAAQHKDISTDPNAKKLALKYRPQVVLTAQSLFTLMNNHGVNYSEQWELPVCVKAHQDKDGQPLRMVYIDPPLPKKQMSVRERNQMFHEVPFDFWLRKNTSIDVSAVVLSWLENKDVPQVVEPPETEGPSETEIDFECDVTELETFGVSSNPVNSFKKPSSPLKPQRFPPTLPDKFQMGKKILSGSGESTAAQNRDPPRPVPVIPEISNLLDQSNRVRAASLYESLFCESDDAQSFKGFASDELEEFVESDPDADTSDGLESSSETPTKKTHLRAEIANLNKEKDEDVARTTSYTSDTDEECLVIDTGDIDNQNLIGGKVSSASRDLQNTSRASFPTAGQSESSIKEGHKKGSPPRKRVKRLSKDLDPVGQILKMQSEMMKANPKKAVEQPCGSPEKSSPAGKKETPSLAPALNHCPGIAPNTAPGEGSFQTETQLLPVELQMIVEDTAEYTAPQNGNLVYKLFSLDGMLLLVRCTLQRAKTVSKHLSKSSSRHIPIFLLPKLEYQAHYGVEALTESEICRLWLESRLHAYYYFYIGHIDAFSSSLFMLEEINADGIKERFSSFKPSDSLNILRHILKKVTTLQEGSYLLSHAAGDSSVTIYQNTKTEVTRSAYNLHRAHSYLPRVPSTLSVPWVPLDPTTLLPYHVSKGRAPCTFPPRPEGRPGKKRADAHRKNCTEGADSSVPATGTKTWSPKKKYKKK